jgi:hypothetical protein
MDAVVAASGAVPRLNRLILSQGQWLRINHAVILVHAALQMYGLSHHYSHLTQILASSFRIRFVAFLFALSLFESSYVMKDQFTVFTLRVFGQEHQEQL